ncbi:MAG: hypothetical protein CVU11_02500 [Bacteroidetes bacterium HGW-Bacteroidetes-6]|nr:MAG: hypothetical protein CVU11_02500 [Bacteroidetes bacterium HGW-Bacteroidetes-6]
MFRKQFLAIILSFFTVAMYGQKDDCYRNVPYFRSLKPVNLAHRLTKGLESDSAKVCAIHSWITHKIKYDVKKFKRFDYAHVPVKKILRRRKAVCVGYADLFTALCRYSGINAIDVSGYSRNIFYDVGDGFFLADHAWNAVQINGTWKLVDATWDAGYIKNYRRTFFGFIEFCFTLGHREAVKYRPHFKKHPTDWYFLRGGSFFSFDHVAADPLWLLTDSIAPVCNYENDSAFYYRKLDDADTLLPCLSGEFDRVFFSTTDFQNKKLFEGFNMYKFNHKNQLPIAESYSLMAAMVFDTIDVHTTDTARLLQKCDSVILLVDSAIVHYDSCFYYLGTQRVKLDSSNAFKYWNVRENNRLLIGSTRKSLQILARGSGQVKKYRETLRVIINSDKKKMKSIQKSKRFYVAKRPEITFETDSIDALLNLALLHDSLSMLNDSVSARLQWLFQLSDTSLARISAYKVRSQQNKTTAGILCGQRFGLEDDLDYLITLNKNGLMSHKFTDDSLLVYQRRGSVIRYLGDEAKKLRKEMNALYSCHRKISNECVRLKKSTVTFSGAQEQYERNLDEYRKELADYHAEMSNLKNRVRSVATACRKQKKSTRKELKAYKQEILFEMGNYKIRRNYISQRNISLRRICRNYKSASVSMAKKARGLKKKYQKK